MIHASDPRRRHRVAALPVMIAAVLAAALVATVGGCKVSTGQREPASTKVQEVLESGKGHFDLTRPPSRDEAGMPANQTDVTYERDDHTPFQVLVDLPEGKKLEVAARLLTFDALAEPAPKTAPPTTLDIHYYAPSLEAGRDHLVAAARTFGLDTGLIARWYEEATSPRPVQAPPVAESPWLRAQVGYLRLDVQARYSPPVDTPASAQTLVHYLLTWKVGPTSPPS